MYTYDPHMNTHHTPHTTHTHTLYTHTHYTQVHFYISYREGCLDTMYVNVCKYVGVDYLPPSPSIHTHTRTHTHTRIVRFERFKRRKIVHFPPLNIKKIMKHKHVCYRQTCMFVCMVQTNMYVYRQTCMFVCMVHVWRM